MIYVAAPYSHPDKSVVEYRMDMVEKALALLMSKGLHATTPLLMHHVLDKGISLPDNFEFWDKYCFDLLDRCESMTILTLPGWDTSRGVIAEIDFCKKQYIPINHMHVQEIENGLTQQV